MLTLESRGLEAPRLTVTDKADLVAVIVGVVAGGEIVLRLDPLKGPVPTAESALTLNWYVDLGFKLLEVRLKDVVPVTSLPQLPKLTPALVLSLLSTSYPVIPPPPEEAVQLTDIDLPTGTAAVTEPGAVGKDAIVLLLDSL